MGWISNFRKKNKRYKKRVREKSEQATVQILTKIFEIFGINNACEHFLKWADNHRKIMFGITISFLICVTCVAFNQPRQNWKTGLKKEQKKAKIDFFKPLDNQQQRKDISVSDILEVVKLKKSIEELQSKGELTAEDTLEIKALYKKLKNKDKSHETN